MDDDIVSVLLDYRYEAEEARRDRLNRSRQNREAAHNIQDYSDKQEGQSTEFLPRTSAAVQQFKAFIKRGLIQFGHWFDMEMPDDSPISGEDARYILMEFLNNIPVSLFNQESTTIAHVLSDGGEVGLLESLIIMKVHGYKRKKPEFSFEEGKTTFKLEPWNLVIELIKPEDYYPDPTGRKLYEIHRVERDLVDVVRLAEQGVYDKEVVNKIVQDYAKEEPEAKARKTEQDQNKVPPPKFRRRVVIDEFWGTIVKDNKVLHENVFCAMANDTYLIRKPKPNPFWHGGSPFVAGPLTRVPFSVWHRALADDFVPLNKAINEMFNLMLDGGLASVWGIKQLHAEWLEDPRQVSNGISQGDTLAMNDSAPPDGKVLEQVATGQVPTDAMAMFQVLSGEFNAAALTNEIRLGQLPSKQVKATEVVEASQSQAVLLDSIVADCEFYTEQLLKKSWLTILQNMDDIDVRVIDSAVSRRAALILARMPKKDRFRILGNLAYFKVSGLSSLLNRARDFQKLMSIIQLIQGNPLLLQSFFRRFSGDKIIDLMFKQMNLDPRVMERSDEEKASMGKQADDAAVMQQLGLTGSGRQGGGTGGQSQQSEINQEIQSTAGL